MIKYFILNENKIPIQVEWNECSKFLQTQNVVKQDNIEKIRVSTVFLGIDHNWLGSTPILFETMVFGGEYDQYQKRYSTWDEALVGHARIFNMVNK